MRHGWLTMIVTATVTLVSMHTHTHGLTCTALNVKVYISQLLTIPPLLLMEGFKADFTYSFHLLEVVFAVVWVFEIGPYNIALDGLELAVNTRFALNSRSTSF